MKVLFIPGHNSSGNRFTGFAQMIGEIFGLNIEVFKFKREKYKNGFLVSTISVEYEQIKKYLKKNHDQYVVVGHSQGGPIALKLASEGLVVGAVSLFGDPDAKEDVRFHLKKINKTLAQLKKEKYVAFGTNTVFWYTPEFFEDYKKWNIPSLAKNSKVPLLFIAGTNDVFNTPEKTKKLFDIAATPKQYATITSDHKPSYFALIKIIRRIKKWVEEFIPQ